MPGGPDETIVPRVLARAVQGEGMSRRHFLKTSLGIGVVLLAAKSAAVLTGCRAAPTADLVITSSVDFNHSHKVTVPGADIDSRPSEKTYTSDGATHTHAITMKKTDFEAVGKGQVVTLTSTATGTTPHTHNFAIQKV